MDLEATDEEAVRRLIESITRRIDPRTHVLLREPGRPQRPDRVRLALIQQGLAVPFELSVGEWRDGRNPGDLLIFTLCTVITGQTEAEARQKHAEYRLLCRHRGGAGAVLGLDRGRFREVRARRRAALHRDRGDALGAGLVYFGRPGPGLDRSRAGRASRDRRSRSAVRRLSRADRRHADRVGAGDRCGWVQPGLCGHPGEL